MQVRSILTKPYLDQKPGTSGLRKKVTVFTQENYLANFVQATFNALTKTEDGIPPVLLVGGDGRYYGKEACQTILQIAAANGVKRVWVGQNGLLSTPAVSAIVRNREGGFVAKGAFILTASHNPGGPTEDFGIKYNGTNGGPAPEKFTNLLFEETKVIQEVKVCDEVPQVDLSKLGKTEMPSFSVEVIDSTDDYVKLLSTVFDFDSLRKLMSRKDFTFIVDAMHGVGGPYARKLFVDILGGSEDVLLNAEPKEDFGKGHPDPNLTYAKELVSIMGLTRTGLPVTETTTKKIPDLGAASDGDADRNMILGKQFFVTPSDSVAVLAAQSKCIPFFRPNGVRSVARSMPTSGALDRVAKDLGIFLAEVPTGWKFFGNLMDSKDIFNKEDYNPLMCGEESFGTGSNHVREKDGMWAVLAWMSVLASHNEDHTKPLVSVQEIVEGHWRKYGRNFYCRYDYEGVESDAAKTLMDRMRAMAPESVSPLMGSTACKSIDDFCYTDPVDESVSANQGIRVLFEDGSRFVFRLSGTGSSGATIRLYIEQYMSADEVTEKLKANALPSTGVALKALVELALNTSNLVALTGREEPSVIT